MISDDAKKIRNAVEKRIDSVEKEFNIELDKIKQLEENKQRTKEIKSIKKELLDLRNVKKWFDFEYILLFTVTLLVMSIVLGIINQFWINYLNYLFLTLGISFTMGLVFMWELMRRISNKYKLV